MDKAIEGIEIVQRNPLIIPTIILALGIVIIILGILRFSGKGGGKYDSIIIIPLGFLVTFVGGAWSSAVASDEYRVHRAHTEAALENHYDVILPQEFFFALERVQYDHDTVEETGVHALNPDGTFVEDLVIVTRDNNISLWVKEGNQLTELNH